MKKVAVVTDSNAGIRQKEAKELGIFVLPMPFTIDDQTYFEDINLTHEEFFEKQLNGAEIFTSQPVVGNSQRISVTQKYDVIDAKRLADQGKSGQEICDILTENKLNASIYITVNTLDYLKKGGRITPAAALLGGMLKIKPILQIQGEKLDSFAKTRTMARGTKIMKEAIAKDIKERFDDDYHNMHICVAYTYDEAPALELKKELEELYPGENIICDPLSLSVSCHIGPHSLAIAICKKI